jgi:hypothetical protein
MRLFFGDSVNKMTASVNQQAFSKAVGFCAASLNVWALPRKINFIVVIYDFLIYH